MPLFIRAPWHNLGRACWSLHNIQVYHDARTCFAFLEQPVCGTAATKAERHHIIQTTLFDTPM